MQAAIGEFSAGTILGVDEKTVSLNEFAKMKNILASTFSRH